MNFRFWKIIAIIGITSWSVQGQELTPKDKTKILNEYVKYVNEINNYLPIFNSILVDFNMNLNKFVDLPDAPPSNFSNALMPGNIFDDVFLNESPNAIYSRILNLSASLPAQEREKLNTLARKLKENSNKLNNIRFDIENLMNTLDLTSRENVGKVYEKLEIAATCFKDFRSIQIDLEKELKAIFQSQKIDISKTDQEYFRKLDMIYLNARIIADALYTKNDDDFESMFTKHREAVDLMSKTDFKNAAGTPWAGSGIQNKWKNILQQSQQAITAEKSFMAAEEIPEKYRLYDKYYYYYNHVLISRINRFGIGIASEMNELILTGKFNFLYYFEIPQIYKVIYPKLLDKTPFLQSSDPMIKALPKQVKGRDVIVANRTIKVDSFVVYFELYDHMIVDNDIVSVSFNGDWIVEKFKISDKKFNFSLKLNDAGKNFLLLYADDMGKRPPATIALAYQYQGKRQEIILKSDDKVSEIIEIQVEKEQE
jgi:hypothetical protein